MKTRGFTLIEVLAALFIVAWVMGAVAVLAEQSIDDAAHVRDRTLASWVASDRLVAVRLDGGWPAPGQTDGTDSEGDQTFYWHQTISNTRNPRVRAVKVEVFATRDAGTALLDREGFIVQLQP